MADWQVKDGKLGGLAKETWSVLCKQFSDTLLEDERRQRMKLG